MKLFSIVGGGIVCGMVFSFSSASFAALSCGAEANCYINSAYSTAMASIPAGKFKASWSLSDSNVLKMTLQAETLGWVAVGFSKTGTMDDTDFIIGGYKDSTTYGDDFFYNNTGPNCPQCAPVRDTTLQGGQNNLLSLSSSEADGVTTLSFSRYLNTGNTIGDYDLSSGSYDLIWAVRNQNAGGTGDNMGSFHSGGRGVLAANVNFVPLPSAFWLLGSALAGLVSLRRRSQ